VAVTITENELLDALREAYAGKRGAEGFTARETARVLGVSVRQAQYRLRDLLDAGVLQPVQVVRQDPWGLVRQVPGYQFVKPAKKK
jgi:Fic family protein